MAADLSDLQLLHRRVGWAYLAITTLCAGCFPSSRRAPFPGLLALIPLGEG